MAIHFISDLHLSAEQPALTTLFTHYLQHQATEADALFVLGDMFEVWLGDDMILPEYQPAIDAINELTARGIPVYVMYGNRDFLMREQFEQLTGAQLINDPTVIDLYGIATLIMHGDTLCIDDIEYQEFRKIVRNPEWQNEFLSKTTSERLAIAREYREKSKAATKNKNDDIMDVNQQEVEQVMRKYQVTRLIHGHTHRPGTHHFRLDNNDVCRIVLADWNKSGSYLVCDEQQCRDATITL
ncbi:MAG: UDP-2,3-diacylglucosamine diphosphatase [Gammaproteobacteria bacterium]|jgi:UDP-2,3-diacylglucosamine hydrolase